MSTKKRLQDVNSYGLIDTPPDQELDEITELASIICSTPIASITVLDDKRQYFKSNKGLSVNETRVEDSFCQHTLNKPNEVLVVKDALKDERFVDNKLVLDDPNIRFYAGAPLITKENNVLGTLCIIDRKPRDFSSEQERALQILAKKAMDIIETQKNFKKLNTSVKLSTERLTKITENVPLGIFELIVSQTGDLKFAFLSEGMKKIHPDINFDEWITNAEVGFSVVHPDDVQALQEAMANSIEKEERLYHEYRVKSETGYDWHAINGQPQKIKNGDSIIYGSFIDVTHHVEYEAALEQIAFDISHVLRRPVTSMLGVTNLLELEKELSSEKIREYSGYITTITEELEEFTRELDKIYSEKKQKVASQNINIRR